MNYGPSGRTPGSLLYRSRLPVFLLSCYFYYEINLAKKLAMASMALGIFMVLPVVGSVTVLPTAIVLRVNAIS